MGGPAIRIISILIADTEGCDNEARSEALWLCRAKSCQAAKVMTHIESLFKQALQFIPFKAKVDSRVEKRKPAGLIDHLNPDQIIVQPNGLPKPFMHLFDGDLGRSVKTDQFAGSGSDRINRHTKD